MVNKSKNLNNVPGFTLIELMIVVAVIAILVAIAIPKFADLLRKSHEGATKGKLSMFRSTLHIYSADNEGQFPGDAGPSSSRLRSALIPVYLNDIPEVNLAHLHPPTKNVGVVMNDVGEWHYIKSEGYIGLDCTHTDTKGVIVSSW